MYRVEQHLLKLEFLLNRAATSFFNTRDSGADFDDTLQRLAKVLKDERPESGRWEVYKDMAGPTVFSGKSWLVLGQWTASLDAPPQDYPSTKDHPGGHHLPQHR